MDTHEPLVCVWMQFCLVMHYLSEMTEEQTLVMYSGHPMGLFPSLPSSPRAIITNGMVHKHRIQLPAHGHPSVLMHSLGCVPPRLFRITHREISMKKCLLLVYRCKF